MQMQERSDPMPNPSLRRYSPRHVRRSDLQVTISVIGTAMSRVLMPLPGLDFDPTESAGSWLMLTEAGHRVQFATPDGRPGVADDIMLTGRGLDFWGFIPGLRNFTLLGKILR